jgi:uncharacterized protein (DUF305 family)
MRWRRLLVALLALTLVAGACGSDEDNDVSSSSTEESSTEDGGTAATDEAEHNQADVEFAQSMIPHHAQAIEMAEMAIESGESADVKALAEGIKAAQQPEIDMLTDWLEGWGEDVPSTSDGMGHGDMASGENMMSEDDMASLESATGAEFDRMFLEMMTEHHRGAISMAETEVDEGEYPDAIEMAETIIETQQAEIEEMEQMLQAM